MLKQKYYNIILIRIYVLIVCYKNKYEIFTNLICFFNIHKLFIQLSIKLKKTEVFNKFL